MPFGGAGPLLAAEIAEELGIREILVPPNPGVISALGLLSADYMKVSGVTRRTGLTDAAPRMLADEFDLFRKEAETEFRRLGLNGNLDFDLTADMRFVGQAFEIPVPVDTAALSRLGASDLAADFDAAHRRIYFHGGEPGRNVEIVSLRFGVRRRLETLPEFHERPAQLAGPGSIEVWTPAGVVKARLVDAASIASGQSVDGGALVEGYSSTLWLPPAWRAARDKAGNLIMSWIFA